MSDTVYATLRSMFGPSVHEQRREASYLDGDMAAYYRRIRQRAEPRRWTERLGHAERVLDEDREERESGKNGEVVKDQCTTTGRVTLLLAQSSDEDIIAPISIGL